MEYEKKEVLDEKGRVKESAVITDNQGNIKKTSKGANHYMVKIYNGQHTLKFTGFQNKNDDGSFKQMPKIGDYVEVLYNRSPNPHAKPDDEEWMKWYKNFFMFKDAVEPVQQQLEQSASASVDPDEIKNYIDSYKKLCDDKAVRPTKAMAIGLFMSNHRKDEPIVKKIIEEFNRVM